MEYIFFERHPELEKGKTQLWAVVSSRSGYVLGWVKWFGRWRQYAFFPEFNTIWNPTCLRLVNSHIGTLMAERKK